MFNTLSNLRQTKKKSFISRQQKTSTQLVTLRNCFKNELKRQNLQSKHFLLNTLKTLIFKIRTNKLLKHLNNFSINSKSFLQHGLKLRRITSITAFTNTKFFNEHKVANRSLNFNKKLPQVLKKLKKKKFKMILKRPIRQGRRRRARYLKQENLTTFIFPKPLILQTFLTRKRR
jgi:hypothetical protein